MPEVTKQNEETKMEEDVEFNRMQNTIAALVRAAAATTTDDEFKAKDDAVVAWTGRHITEQA